MPQSPPNSLLAADRAGEDELGRLIEVITAEVGTPALLVGREPRRRTTPQVSGAAHDRDQLAKGPLFDEILASLRAQCGANGRLGSINVAHHSRLDLLVLPGKSDQDDVTDPEALYGELDRH